jgi:pseudaminic acid synthase
VEKIKINDNIISNEKPPYIIAELSGNHNGKIENAIKLIEIAKKAKVDAVKLQTYTADTITINNKSSDFLIKSGPWKGRFLYDLYEEAHTPWDWHPKLFEVAKSLNIDCFSSPFDHTAVDFLEKLNVPAYKVASFECIDLPLLSYISSKKKPLIVSTGMANSEEINEIIKTVKTKSNAGMVLLHCISAYPSKEENYHLKTIEHLRKETGCLIGLSDHTLGNLVACLSVAFQSCIIEKHITLARSNGGPDADFSLEPEELKTLVTEVKKSYKAIGNARKKLVRSEKSSYIFRRSLYATKDIQINETITEKNIRSIRPGYGIEPKYYYEVLGKQAVSLIKAGTALNWSLFK